MRSVTKTISPVWSILELLPERVRREIYDFADAHMDFEEKINEIRLRRAGRISLSSDMENIILPMTVSKEEIEQSVRTLCDGSVYAHSDTINQGYITLKNGCRVGIVGRAVCTCEKIVSVCDISSLNIRIPHNISGVGAPVIDMIKQKNFLCSVLIYSDPGVGKTTLLRSLASEIAKTKRVAVIDSRAELDNSYSPIKGLSDILSCYPKGEGIEIALRTLSPEYIICDEIGADEVASILAVHGSGVPMIASVHASNFLQLEKKAAIKKLLDAELFELYVGIGRKKGERDYTYDIRGA